MIAATSCVTSPAGNARSASSGSSAGARRSSAGVEVGDQHVVGLQRLEAPGLHAAAVGPLQDERGRREAHRPVGLAGLALEVASAPPSARARLAACPPRRPRSSRSSSIAGDDRRDVQALAPAPARRRSSSSSSSTSVVVNQPSCSARSTSCSRTGSSRRVATIARQARAVAAMRARGSESERHPEAAVEDVPERHARPACSRCRCNGWGPRRGRSSPAASAAARRSASAARRARGSPSRPRGTRVGEVGHGDLGHAPIIAPGARGDPAGGLRNTGADERLPLRSSPPGRHRPGSDLDHALPRPGREVLRAASHGRARVAGLIADALAAPPPAAGSGAGGRPEGDPARRLSRGAQIALEETDPRLSRSLLRGLSILTRFDPATPERGIVELAGELGMSPSTTHRYAQTLVRLGLLERCPTTRKYRLPAR